MEGRERSLGGLVVTKVGGRERSLGGLVVTEVGGRERSLGGVGSDRSGREREITGVGSDRSGRKREITMDLSCSISSVSIAIIERHIYCLFSCLPSSQRKSSSSLPSITGSSSSHSSNPTTSLAVNLSLAMLFHNNGFYNI